jgi:restriction endonuclease S subunit
VLLSTVRPNLKAFAYLENLPEKVLASTGFAVLHSKEDVVAKFLYFSVLSDNAVNQMINQMGKGAYPSINSSDVENVKIPLPPLEVQREIVAEIEGYQKLIDGARQVVESWKPQIEIDPEWPVIPLGKAITLQRGYDLPKTKFIEGAVPVIGSNGIIGYHNILKEKGPGVVTGRSGTIGKVHFIDCEYYWPHNTALFVKEFNSNDRKFIKFLLESIDLKSLGDNVAAVPSLDRKNAHRINISLPPLKIQQEIVTKIESERKVIDGCRDLIKIYEEKIKRVIDKVWEE